MGLWDAGPHPSHSQSHNTGCPMRRVTRESCIYGIEREIVIVIVIVIDRVREVRGEWEWTGHI